MGDHAPLVNPGRKGMHCWLGSPLVSRVLLPWIRHSARGQSHAAKGITAKVNAKRETRAEVGAREKGHDRNKQCERRKRLENGGNLLTYHYDAWQDQPKKNAKIQRWKDFLAFLGRERKLPTLPGRRLGGSTYLTDVGIPASPT